MVIVLELRHWEQVVPVVLPFVHKYSKELVKLLIDPFHLAVRLWMPGHRGCDLDP